MKSHISRSGELLRATLADYSGQAARQDIAGKDTRKDTNEDRS